MASVLPALVLLSLDPSVASPDEARQPPAPSGPVRIGRSAATLGLALLATATTLPVAGAVALIFVWQGTEGDFSTRAAAGMMALTVTAVVGLGFLFALPVGAWLGHLAGGGTGTFGGALLGVLAGTLTGAGLALAGAMLLGDRGAWRATAAGLLAAGAGSSSSRRSSRSRSSMSTTRGSRSPQCRAGRSRRSRSRSDALLECVRGGVVLRPAVKPHPVSLDGAIRSERQILIHRRMGCPHYGGCLNESVSAGWESFSCMHCPLAATAPQLPQELGRYANQRKDGGF